MKYPKFFVSALTVVGISGFSNIAIAQTPPPLASQQSLQEFQQPAQSNFAIGNSGSGLNLLQLIQSASLLEGKSAKEVTVGQKETLDEASLQFRKQQRQQLGVTNPILVDGANPKK
ncbi:hypothetical protein Syn7502_00820 [Synechococcus sp. PCC 7502]|uniref:hypothetical protein n=1 Tax=Synechococcus sp. PCC 7502 TaxID=1173263 RepID=UPI00029FE965|nr:hypothetical protein [Synechococcus sp. PCC 7502]AFY72952.1 hypothetical protein Syn7502_00820 [Synechococcus sp. PCC 7502]